MKIRYILFLLTVAFLLGSCATPEVAYFTDLGFRSRFGLGRKIYFAQNFGLGQFVLDADDVAFDNYLLPVSYTHLKDPVNLYYSLTLNLGTQCVG